MSLLRRSRISVVRPQPRPVPGLARTPRGGTARRPRTHDRCLKPGCQCRIFTGMESSYCPRTCKVQRGSRPAARARHRQASSPSSCRRPGCSISACNPREHPAADPVPCCPIRLRGTHQIWRPATNPKASNKIVTALADSDQPARVEGSLPSHVATDIARESRGRAAVRHRCGSAATRPGHCVADQHLQGARGNACERPLAPDHSSMPSACTVTDQRLPATGRCAVTRSPLPAEVCSASQGASAGQVSMRTPPATRSSATAVHQGPV